MRVLVLDEVAPETRVALIPDHVQTLRGLGLDVAVIAGAGVAAFFDDAVYSAMGADIVPANLRHEAISRADVVLTVRTIDELDAKRMKAGSLALCFMQPTASLPVLEALTQVRASAVSFELIPRISRAQSMDALTSQALVAGYRAGLVAAEMLPKFFPLFMTAAGTIQPARVLVLGAGVAGLQAIATAKRLGAIVSAYDVRPASADEVKSMGATFITLELDALDGAGGYAREMSEDRAQRQRDLLLPYVAASDVLITTAAVPGRPAPLLVTELMVAAMKTGSVVVDLAAETGGNVEGSQPGEVVTIGGALVWGAKDVPSQMPVHASQLYSANVSAVLKLLTTDGQVDLDLEDEIVSSSLVIHNGVVRHEGAIEALVKGN
ncbi:MAG: NAD(P) transhydrogenase subunit alpha [Actinobacteria bacterium]|nr:NAD(P) transhydrogenase subunit alpha [Actinomycetota bacterium]